MLYHIHVHMKFSATASVRLHITIIQNGGYSHVKIPDLLVKFPLLSSGFQ